MNMTGGGDGPDEPRSTIWVWGSVAVVTSVYVATLLVMPLGGFWINDNGCKFIQVQALVRSDFRDFAIDWPGQELDQTFKYNPLPAPHGYVVDGRLYGTFSPVFTLLSAASFRLTGLIGLYLLPLAGGLLTLSAVWCLAGLLPGRRAGQPLAVLLVALTTPMWFYSVAFWEHTPAACLATWSIVCCVRYVVNGSLRSLIIGGLLCGLAIYLRDELYLLGAVLTLVSALHSRRRGITVVVFVCAFVAAAIPLWLFQWKVLGRPLGLHASMQAPWAAGLGDYLVERWAAVRCLLIDCHRHLSLSVLISLPYLVLLLFFPRVSQRRFAMVATLLAALATLGTLAVMADHLTSRQPILHLVTANSLFAVSPVLVLAFLRKGAAPAEGGRPSHQESGATVQRLLWLIVLPYVGAYVLLAPRPGFTGIHWGCRFLLPAYPVLGTLAASTIVRWWQDEGVRANVGKVTVLATIAVSLAAQLYSLGLLYQRKRFCADFNRIVAERPERTVVTDAWYITQELSHCFFDKRIFLLPSETRAGPLAGWLREADQEEPLLLLSPPDARVRRAGSFVLEDGVGFIRVGVYPTKPPG